VRQNLKATKCKEIRGNKMRGDIDLDEGEAMLGSCHCHMGIHSSRYGKK
jgi:hypothetical protein